MKLVLKAGVIVVAAAVAALLTARFVLVHMALRGAYAEQGRLAAAMAGLFAGGAAAVIVGLVMVRQR